MKENQKNTSPTCKPVGFGNTWILTNYAQKSPHRTHATCQITHVDCWGGWDKRDMLGVQGGRGNWWGGAVWRVQCVEPLICQVGETGKAASIQGPLYGHLSGLNLAHGEGGSVTQPCPAGQASGTAGARAFISSAVGTALAGRLSSPRQLTPSHAERPFCLDTARSPISTTLQ